MSKDETKGVEMSIEQAIGEARELLETMHANGLPTYTIQKQEDLIAELRKQMHAKNAAWAIAQRA